MLGKAATAAARFAHGGAHISFGGQTMTLAAARIGREGDRRQLSARTAATIAGPEVRTDRGAGVTEWWRSLPSGLEHGVTISERPHGRGELVVELDVGGTVVPRLVSHDVIALSNASGARIATYAHLLVIDAMGTTLPGRMAVRDGRIEIAVDDTDARYPVVVDPIVATEGATLVASDAVAADFLGHSLAMSADGSRALLGAAAVDNDSLGIERGCVFVRTGTGWAHEASLIAGSGDDAFGIAVAMSADGSRAVIGGHKGGGTGNARVFLRTGTSWEEEATLRPSDGVVGDRFGMSVALSADGSRAIVGAFQDRSSAGIEIGSARVFLRTGTSWAEEATLVASNGAANSGFGLSVALSADGSRALVGAPRDDTPVAAHSGSARVFLRTGTSWAEETKLFSATGTADDGFGHSVTLSSDGSRALVGVPGSDAGPIGAAGSAQVFLRTGASWTDEATLTASNVVGAGMDFGQSVALSSDGSRALIGVPFPSDAAGDTGSARVFQRTNTSWMEEATLVAADGAPGDQLGSSVALSADGALAIVGAARDTTAAGIYAGSARVFTLLLSIGTPCSSGDACVAGSSCIDGVCCGDACGGGDPTDCQACSIAAGGAADGTCSPRGATMPCGDDGNVCTVDHCDGTSLACQHQPGNEDVPCYDAPANALCEADQVCTGTSPTCPLPALPPDECTAASNDPLECDGEPACLELFGGTDEEGGIEITFLESYEGEVRVEAAGEDCPPSTGFEVVDMGLGENAHGSGMFIDLKANPPITNLRMKICIRYPQGNMSDDDERRLQIQHGTSEGCPAPGDWSQLTEADPQPQPNIDSNIICAYTNSLSPFALVLPADAAGPVYRDVPDTIVAYATSTAGATVSYALPTAIDAVDGPRPVSCTPAHGSTFRPGKTTVTCTASDLGGLTTTATFTVWVQYQAPADGSFFLKPPRPNGSSIFRIGKPVAIKFQLAGASKHITDLQAHLIVTKMSGAIQGTVDDECDEDVDDTDFLFKFRKGKGLYVYRWKTRGETQGTYRLRADLGDEVAHEITVSLRAPR